MSKRISVLTTFIILLLITFFIFNRLNVFALDVLKMCANKSVIVILCAIVSFIMCITLNVFGKTIYQLLKISLNEFLSIFAISVILISVLKSIIIISYIGTIDYIAQFIGAVLLLELFLFCIFRFIKIFFPCFAKLFCGLCWYDYFFIFCLIIYFNIKLILFSQRIKYIFTWDNSGYFTAINSLSKINSVTELLKEVYYSIVNLDYNYVIAFVGVVFYRLFGYSRYVYLLFILNVYVIPFWTCFFLYIRARMKKYLWVVILTVLSFPCIEFLAFSGFIDVGGLVFSIAALVLYKSEQNDFSKYIVVGAILAFLVILRRWYAFYTLSIIITSLIFDIKRPIKPILILLGFSFVLMYFTQKMVSSKLLLNYGEMYSSYKLPIKTDFLLVIRYFGLFIPIICLIYALVCFKENKESAFFVTMSVVCFLLFTRVQTHGQQHLLLYVPQLVIIYCDFANSILKHGKKSSIVLILAAIFCTANPRVKRVQPSSIGDIRSVMIFPSFNSSPPKRGDTDEILRLVNFIDKNIGLKGKTVCLLSSSFMLNEDTLLNAEVSLSKIQFYDIDRKSYFLPIAQVDSRDSFSENLFDADFIILPDTLQIHINESQQRVISIPYNDFVYGNGISLHYKKINEKFILDNSINVYIYERTSEINKIERQRFLNRSYEK